VGISATGILAYGYIMIEDSSGRSMLGMYRPEVSAQGRRGPSEAIYHRPEVRNRALYDMYTCCMREGTFLRPLELVRSAARALRLALHIVLGSYPYHSVLIHWSSITVDTAWLAQSLPHAHVTRLLLSTSERLYTALD
jgi:hypothetical protein